MSPLFESIDGDIVRQVGVGTFHTDERVEMMMDFNRVLIFEHDGCLIVATEAWVQAHLKPHNEMG